MVRSPRRRKTVQAREVDGVLRVLIPSTMSATEERRWVAEMTRRMQSRMSPPAVADLEARAARLAARYRLRTPASICWVDNQEWRWGSCTPSAGTVRISSRLAAEPGWVLDYVLVHELAHLEVARHDRRFWAIVGRYPLTERARGFLIARGAEPASPVPAGAGTGGDVGGGAAMAIATADPAPLPPGRGERAVAAGKREEGAGQRPAPGRRRRSR